MKHPTHKTSHKQGQTMLIALFFFMVISLLIILGLADPIVHQLAHANRILNSKQSYMLSEGLIEDIIHRYNSTMQVDSTEELTINDGSANATITATDNGEQINASSTINSSVRNISTTITIDDGVAFNFGVQAGEGGILLENSSEVEGNIFSNGPVQGNGNTIHGTAISAGSNGLVDDIYALGSLYAHEIRDAWTEQDAYYFSDSTITNTVVEGVRYPDSDDQATSSLPISDEKINEWKSSAENEMINDCNENTVWEIKNETVTIGPEKIECDVEIRGNNTTVNVAGPVWIEGELLVKNGPTVQVDTTLGEKSVAIITDEPGNTGFGAQINLNNKGDYFGGDGNSHLIFISQNDSAKQGGNNIAINVANNMSGDVLVYAGHGEIFVGNSIEIHGITAYRVHARNTATIIYQTGMANLLFDTGPSGSYTVHSWNEIE